MMPSRHALDALLLDQDYFEEAIDAYKGQQLRFRKRFNINTIN